MISKFLFSFVTKIVGVALAFGAFAFAVLVLGSILRAAIF